MAEAERDFDDGEGEGEGDGGKAKGSKKMIIIIAAAVLLLAGGGGAAYVMTKGDAEEAAAAAEGEEGEEEDEDVPQTPHYFSFNPPFVVNFVGKSRAKFLQVTIDGLTRDPLIKEDITTHLPQIRNNIVLLLSSKTYDELIAPDGKEKLRKEVLKEVKKILRKETGKDEVENVFFTSFVMQ